MKQTFGESVESNTLKPDAKLINNWPPESGELNDEKLQRLASESGLTVSIKVPAVQHEDGWYIHFPNGKVEKLKLSQNDRTKDVPMRYLNYDPHGGDLTYSETLGSKNNVEAKYKK